MFIVAAIITGSMEVWAAAIATGIIAIILFIVAFMGNKDAETERSGSLQILNHQNQILYSKHIILSENQVDLIINSIHNNQE